MKNKSIFLGLYLVCLVSCVTTPETGRRAFILTSEGQEMSLGAQAYQEVLKKERISSNRRWNEILQRVGNRIAAAANKPSYAWEFKLIESDQKNAFCLPGGKVAVYTGILPVMQNEAGMAVVIGHEVAHATARHGGQRMTMAMTTSVGLAALDKAIGQGGKNKDTVMAALGLGAQVGAVLPFSRANESEADEIGLIYAARAGYDPREAPRFWGRFAKESKGGVPTFLSTHPSSASRQQALEEQVGKVSPIYETSPKHGIGEAF